MRAGLQNRVVGLLLLLLLLLLRRRRLLLLQQLLLRQRRLLLLLLACNATRRLGSTPTVLYRNGIASADTHASIRGLEAVGLRERHAVGRRHVGAGCGDGGHHS